ncbi:MAG: hypothetical protein ACKN95_03165, partial [Holophagaceae bacterium]
VTALTCLRGFESHALRHSLSHSEQINSIKKDYKKRVERLKRNYKPNPQKRNSSSINGYLDHIG